MSDNALDICIEEGVIVSVNGHLCIPLDFDGKICVWRYTKEGRKLVRIDPTGLLRGEVICDMNGKPLRTPTRKAKGWS